MSAFNAEVGAILLIVVHAENPIKYSALRVHETYLQNNLKFKVTFFFFFFSLLCIYLCKYKPLETRMVEYFSESNLIFILYSISQL